MFVAVLLMPSMMMAKTLALVIRILVIRLVNRAGFYDRRRLILVNRLGRLLYLVVRWNLPAYRRNLDANRWSWVVGHLNGIVAPTELVGHVVANRPILIKGLSCTALNVFQMAYRRAFNAVAQDGTSNYAKHGGSSVASTPPHLVSNSTTSNRPHCRTGTRLLLLNFNLLRCADLTRHRDLLQDGLGREHSSYLVGECHARGGYGYRENQQFLEYSNLTLS